MKKIKIQRIVWVALVCSLIVHAGFLLWSSYVEISPLQDSAARVRRFFNIRRIKETSSRQTHKAVLPKVKALKATQPLQPTAAMMSPIRYQEKEISSKVMMTPQVVKSAAQPVKSNTPQEPEVNTRKKDWQKVRESQRKTRASLVPVTNINTAADEQSLQKLLAEQDLPENFLDRMPGFTPRAIQSTGLTSGINVDKSSWVTESFTRVVKQKELESLKKFLDYDVATYQDPTDGQRYYRISVRAGEDTLGLPTVAKEIIFLVDCSLSIEARRLEELKQGLQYGLKRLNPQDRFNIRAFKENIISFRKNSVPPTPENIIQALAFVSDLTAGQKTDTYEALYKTIQMEHVMSPSYLIFLSDGHATKGVTDSRRIINKIAAANEGRVAIFGFSGGLRVNRYLLDFIAYKNRGWTEYSYRTHQIGDKMGLMVDKISDPILLNLRYYISGVDTGNIFPRLLPDFFRNAEFTLYGTYGEEDEFFLQLLGDVDGKAKEFVIKASLKNATSGDRDIAKHWAFNKIYHLIGLLGDHQRNEALIRQIHALSKKFGIKTPYSKSIK